MKRIFKLALLLVLVLIGCSTIWADSGTKKTSRPQTIVLKPRDVVTTRPRTPSMQEITCAYMDSYIYFGFAIPEGECEMVLTDLSTGGSVTATFDSEDCEPIYVGELESAEVTLTTENGHTYYGEW